MVGMDPKMDPGLGKFVCVSTGVDSDMLLCLSTGRDCVITAGMQDRVLDGMAVAGLGCTCPGVPEGSSLVSGAMSVMGDEGLGLVFVIADSHSLVSILSIDFFQILGAGS